MGLFDMLFGNDKTSPQQQHGQSADDQAVARYRYMLKTAPPETVEEAHAEAFARLTPEQRSLVLQSLSESVPSAERTVPRKAPTRMLWHGWPRAQKCDSLVRWSGP